MKRIREFFESILFAGMKPGTPVAPKKPNAWLGPLRGPIDRLISGPAPTDPLYLSNRSTSQKARFIALVGIPSLILLVGIGVALYFLDPPDPKPQKELTAAEITAKLLPDMQKDIKLPPPSDVQVLEAKVDGVHLSGVVQNTTKHEIAVANLIIDLTNTAGSQVGGVNCTVEKIPALGRKAFQVPVKQHDAAFALVREITTK